METKVKTLDDIKFDISTNSLLVSLDRQGISVCQRLMNITAVNRLQKEMNNNLPRVHVYCIFS